MHPKQIKDRAIVHYLHFRRSLRGVSRVYGLGKSTLGRWIRAEGGAERRDRVPLHRSLSDMVGTILQSNPFFKGHHVVAELRQQGIKASESTVCRARRIAGYSRKRVRPCFRPRPPTPDGAREYLAALDAAPEALAIDETCIYVEEAPRYGYSRKGERCVFRRRQPQRTGKVTLLMAISEQRGVVSSKVVKGSVNAAVFASFVDGLDACRGSVGKRPFLAQEGWPGGVAREEPDCGGIRGRELSADGEEREGRPEEGHGGGCCAFRGGSRQGQRGIHHQGLLGVPRAD